MKRLQRQNRRLLSMPVLIFHSLRCRLGGRDDYSPYSALYYPQAVRRVFVSMWDNAALLGKAFCHNAWGKLYWDSVYQLLFGSLAAVWIESSSLAKKTIYPLIVASQTIPIIALSPNYGHVVWV